MEIQGIDSAFVTLQCGYFCGILNQIDIYFVAHTTDGDPQPVRTEARALDRTSLNRELAQETGIVVDFHCPRTVPGIHARRPIITGGDYDVGLRMARHAIEFPVTTKGGFG